MNSCKRCGSGAINPHCHDRDDTDLDLCDVCYWRIRAKRLAGEGNEKLRAAIRRAGFEVCQTSGDWTLHDVSEYGKAEEAKSLEVATKNVDLEIENKQLRADVERLNQMLRETGQGQGAIDSYVAQCEELDRLRSENRVLWKCVRDPKDRTSCQGRDGPREYLTSEELLNGLRSGGTDASTDPHQA